MMVMSNAIVIIDHRGRRSAWLPSAPLDMEYDSNIAVQSVGPIYIPNHINPLSS